MSPKYTRPISRGSSFDDVRRSYARTVHARMEEGEDGITALDCHSSRSPALAGIPGLCGGGPPPPCLICHRVCLLCIFCWWTCWVGQCQEQVCLAPDKSEKEEA